MKFQELKPNFLSMEFDEQLSFIVAYTETRQRELSEIKVNLDSSNAKKGMRKTKDKQLKLTGEQLKLLKQLGLI